MLFHRKQSEAEKDAKHSLMTYAEVCQRADCKKFSRLVMGIDLLGKFGENNSLEMLNLAVEYGINAFDTASIYENGIERILGEWMKAISVHLSERQR